MRLSPFEGIVSKTGPGLAIQEVLYGFIMGLIFVTAARVGVLDYPGKVHLAVLIIGMNLTWGAIDAVVFYLVGMFDQRNFVRIMSNPENLDETERIRLLEYAFSGTPLDLLEPESEREICRNILKQKMQSEEQMAADRRALMESSIACFIITALTIIPIILPILLVEDVATGLAASSALSSIVLFFIGFKLEKYVGVNRWVLGFGLAGVSWAITIVSTFTGG